MRSVRLVERLLFAIRGDDRQVRSCRIGSPQTKPAGAPEGSVIDAKAVLIGFFLTLDQSGVSNAAQKACRAARSAGIRFDEAKAAEWIRSQARQEAMFEPDAPTASYVKKQVDDLLWVEEVENAARSIARKTMGALTPGERITLGRFHVLRFANCRKTEATNRTRGMRAATAFAGMASSPRYASMTVKEYVEVATQVHEANGRAPWFDPWRIRVFQDGTDARGSARGVDASEILRQQGGL